MINQADYSLVSGHINSDNASLVEVGDREAAAEDEEYTRIFSRIAELEKEEEEAEKSNKSDEDEHIPNDPDSTSSNTSNNQEVRSLPVRRFQLIGALGLYQILH